MRKPRILVLEGLSGSSSALRRAGAETVKVSPHDPDAVEKALVTDIHGLFLTGGGDVDPRLYSDHARKEVYGVSENRDYSEWLALEFAQRVNIPVFGICRGAQIMNVQAGGTLYQHIPARLKHHGHSRGHHSVKAAGGSKVRRAFRAAEAEVVSLHHQSVARLAEGFRVTARADDGTVEAIESFDGRCVGVQFHPEMATERPAMARLFGYFVADCGERAGIQVLPDTWHRSKPKPKRVGKKTRVKSERLWFPVTTTYRCPKCNIDFDERQDHFDHMTFIHGVDLHKVYDE